ncbi:MAG: hypothetical protein JO091_10965 [Acidobacteriaceae bacterium]|nr:hypothetical protein [Acidobacteriaceae bacterium]
MQKRFSHGLDFLFTYTWAKAMSNGEGGIGVSASYNLRESHAPSSWDRTHTVTLTCSWDLPCRKRPPLCIGP